MGLDDGLAQRNFYDLRGAESSPTRLARAEGWLELLRRFIHLR